VSISFRDLFACKMFAVLIRTGILPESVCEECNDIWGRRTADPRAA
jgi:hypothetical protein